MDGSQPSPLQLSLKAIRTIRTIRRGAFRQRGAQPSRAGFTLHLFGMIALVLGLLLPLTDVGQALANPGANERRAMFAQDDPQGSPQSVVLAGDFQNQLGCGDFDAGCQQSQLQDDDGIWTGQVPVTPGSYSYSMVVTDANGNQVTVDDGSVDVGDDQTGIYSRYNAHTNEVTVSAQDALFVVETGEGSFVAEQDGDQLTVLIPSQGGSTDVQLTANGEPAGESQQVDLGPGSNRITLGLDGSVTNVESLPYATVTIQRADDGGQPLAGSCFEIRDGDTLVNRGCDADDGTADGSTVMSFPGGFDPGTFTLVETQGPDGGEPAGDQDITLDAGDNQVQVQTGGGAGSNTGDQTPETSDGGDVNGETPEGGVIGADGAATETPASDEGGDQTTPDATEDVQAEPGDLIVTLQDGEGNTIPGACFQLIDGDQNVVAEACDDNDNFPNNGNAGFFGVPSGTYTLRESRTPDGSDTVEDRQVDVPAGGEDTVVVEATVTEQPTEEVTPEPTDEVTPEATEEVTPEPTAEVTPEPTTEVETPEGGDEGGNVIGASETPAGETPEPATGAETPEGTASAEPGDLIITLNDENGQPLGGACFELVTPGTDDVVATACDSDDPFPDNGRTGFFGVPSGTYSLRQPTTPDGYQPIEPIEVEVVPGTETERTVDAVPANDQPRDNGQTPAGVTPESTDETPSPESNEGDVVTPEATGPAQTGVLFDFTTYDLEGPPICVELNTSGGIGLADPPSACDNDDNDGDRAEGRILLSDVPAGEYAVSVTDGPESVTALEIPPVTVVEGETATARVEPPPAEPETGSIEIVINDEDGNRVDAGGTCASIDGVTTGICDNDDGDANGDSGVILVEDVPVGSYSVLISAVPEGFDAPADPVQVEVTANETASEPLTLPTTAPETGSIEIVINDEDGIQVATEGTCLSVPGVSENLCDNAAADGNGDVGVILVENVPAGPYEVSITAQPDGFDLPADSVSAEVTAGETVSEPVTLPTTAPETGTITINVVDGENNAIAGGCFTVSNSSGTIEFCDEDGDGTIEIPDVVFGEQTVTQTSSADGYVVDPEPQTPALSVDEPAVDLTFTNAVAAANLPVVATDADGNPLPGACWEITNADGESLATGCDDGSNGDTAGDGTVTFTGLPAGTLTVTQTTAPDGYQPAEAREVTTTSGDNEPLAIEQTVAPITIEVTSRDAEGNPLGGACVALDGGTPVCDDDGDGIVQFGKVAPGDHTLAQTTAPEGFNAAADLPVTAETGGETQFALVNDSPLTGSVEITVTDAGGDPVPGACAAIGEEYTACDNDQQDRSAGDGAIVIEDVVPGDYEVTISGLDDSLEEPAATPVTVVANETVTVAVSVEAAPPQTGSVRVDVQSQADASALTGSCVILSQGGSVVAGPVCDNDEGDSEPAEGTVVISEVPEGTYSVTLDPDQTDGIPGFRGASTRSVTISAAQEGEVVITVVVEGQQATGTVEIVTRDNSTSSRLAGACYTLGDVAVCDGDELDQNGVNGIIQLDDIAFGTYSLAMTTAPEGYATAGDRDVEVAQGAQNRVEVRIDALPDSGTLTITKVDGDGAALGGACFGLVQDGRTLRSICDANDDTPNDGVMLLGDLAAGRYRLVETSAPSSGYQVADPRIVTIVAGEDTPVTVTNVARPGRVVVTTVNAADASSRLPGACYRLEGDVTYGPFCDAADGGSDGRTAFINLVPGDYSLVQTVAPEKFVAADPQDVTVTAGSSQQIEVANAVAPPPEQTGDLVVHKLDADRKVLPGGCFRLFDGQTPVTGQVCDNADGTNDGLIRFVDAPAGTWILRETLAPSTSYQIAADIEVTVGDGQSVDVDVVNVLKNGRVLVNVRTQDGNILQGACFDLASDGRGTRCSDASGVVGFANLGVASYRLQSISAPYGYDRPGEITGIQVRPGETTVIDVVIRRTPPPPNSGSIQVQKFFCPAGTGTERTQFLGGADGSAELRKTSGCTQGNAAFSLALEGSSGSPLTFSTGDDGQYQAVVGQGTYVLTETDPDLGGSSSARVRVYNGQQTTVVVINYLAPPEPEPATINVSKYTCTASFNGTLYEDFAQNCSADSQLTNGITVRAQGPVNAKGITGDKGQAGQTTIAGLQPGKYTIFEDRPYTVPTDYLFCGFNQDNPADWKAVNGRLEIQLDYGQVLTCKVFDIPEVLTDDTGTILVRKYVCEVKNPPKGYNWEEECSLSTQGAEFDLRLYNGENKAYEEATRAGTNPDGLLRYTRLVPGTYQLREVESNWCHAESNSVNANGDVVVTAGKLAEVWIYNCVDTTSPPNTGSGSAANLLQPGGGAPDALAVALSLAWPVLAAGAWLTWRRRMLAPRVVRANDGVRRRAA